MTSTQWSMPSDGSAAHLYTTYEKKGYDYKTRKGGYCYADWPSGQLWTTPGDLAIFATAMLKRGSLGRTTSDGANCVYSEVMGDLVYKKTSEGTGDGDSAYGWFVGAPYYKNGAGHDGSEQGVSADFYIHFQSNVGVGFLANGELNNGEYRNIQKKLMETAKTIGPIDNDFDPDDPKDCSTTWKDKDTEPTPSPPPCKDKKSKFYTGRRKNGKKEKKKCKWLKNKTKRRIRNFCKVEESAGKFKP